MKSFERAKESLDAENHELRQKVLWVAPERLSLSRACRLGSAWLGSAWLDLAWLDLARLGSARLGSARLGLAWLGLAWLGLAGCIRCVYYGRCKLSMLKFGV